MSRTKVPVIRWEKGDTIETIKEKYNKLCKEGKANKIYTKDLGRMTYPAVEEIVWTSPRSSNWLCSLFSLFAVLTVQY